MSFPRYPDYKDSCVDWPGMVPEHWDVTPLKHLASLKGRLGWQGLRSDEYTEEGPYLVTSEHFAGDKIDWNRCHHVSVDRYDLAPEIQLRAHDLLMMKDGAAMGKLAYVDVLPGPACLNSHLLLFRPLAGRFENRFLYYVLTTPSFEHYMFRERAGTTFFGISQESVSAFKFAVPPIDEQHRILSFLERECTRIDGLISQQERLIELLKEKRQAVIAHAVTKGLNPDAPMKASGIDWLGTVPAHWKVLQSRRLFRVRSEPALEADKQLTASQKYGMIFQSDFVEMEGRRVVEVIKGKESLLHVEPNDFVISMRSFQGGLEWCTVRGSTSFHYVILVPAKEMRPSYFAHLLKSATYIQALRTTTDLIRDGQELRYSNFVKVDLPFPPLSEQAAIAGYLDSKTAEIDALVTQTEKAIELLQERRVALISAAVTGQIDVRGYKETKAA
jgi:type I restriction enzyme S subunit